MSGRSDVVDICLVGAGVAGLYALWQCKVSGLSVTCYEAAGDVGGVWYWNRYPGARCDIESIDYSYSFDKGLQAEWRWSENYATQPEILSYFQHAADRLALRDLITFEERVTSAAYDDASATWTVRTASGKQTVARYLVLATGSLSSLNVPDIDGFDSFSGDVLFTAEWPHEPVDFTGKRVGLIGTGSSGVQLAPLVAEQAASLTVFQRSANYSVPLHVHSYTDEEWAEILAGYEERRAVSRVSLGGTPHGPNPVHPRDMDEAQRHAALEQRWQRGGILFASTFQEQRVDLAVNDLAREFAEEKIRAIVHDAQTAEDLIPTDHPIGTKRPITDTGYFEMFNRDHVTLVNLRREPITKMTPEAVVTAEREFEIDVLILATGFDAFTGALKAINPVGVDGVDMEEAWRDGPVTYLGVQVPAFPNMFVVNGPGSPSVLANQAMTAEQQVEWIFDLIRHCRAQGVIRVSTSQEAAAEWGRAVQAAADKTLYPTAKNTWYVGANVPGKPQVFMPYAGGFGTYRQICDEVAAANYRGFDLRTS
ncbi:NAD(P)/FAD-dependent oxidoreductase [Nocardioides sp. J9]|uniref:flavin-containing monooxygenase n=1 Tax=Nocardioides sp. J9 TaxID=935844 RepID=UPI001C941F25|nr:NAD(P)/FAD-dependent oxidoreductase [Nocardioides sp. J9]